MTGSNRLDSLGNTCFIVGDFVVRAYFVVDNKNNDVVKSITFTSLRDELVSIMFFCRP